MSGFRPLLAIACALSIGACARAEAAGDGAAAGKAFLAQNATQPGVITTKSGLQYKILKSGPSDAPTAKLSDRVKVNYEAKLLDGDVVDSSYARGEPAVFGLDGLIPAWREALQLMRPGDTWMLYAPAKLAYGADGAGPIPPNSVLAFKIELIGVNPPGAE